MADADIWDEGFEAGYAFAGRYTNGPLGGSDPPRNPYEEGATADLITITRAQLDQERADAWDEGYQVASDDFTHSDYCSSRGCQCKGNYGQKNPYKEST